MLEDSKCTKTWIDPWPELVVFLWFFLCFSGGVVVSGFNEEPELARKVASFWKHWAALEVRRGSDAHRWWSSPIRRWSRFRQGKELGLRLLREVISKASWDWELLGAGDGLHLSTFVYCEYYICLWNSPFFAYFIHVASFTWWNQTEIPSEIPA